MSPEVRVVLTNWRRPKSVTRIATAYRLQTVPVELVVVDNSGGGEYALEPEAAAMCDDVIVYSQNRGPACRFVGGLLARTEFVLFHDDDMLPGPECIQHYLDSAETIGEFGVLGWLGRQMAWRTALGVRGKMKYPRYSDVNIATRGGRFRAVDFTARGMFVRRSMLWVLEPFRNRIANEIGVERANYLLEHDDMHLGIAVQVEAGMPAMLKPKALPTMSQNGQNLEEGYKESHSQRKDHKPTRAELVQVAFKAGWYPAHI